MQKEVLVVVPVLNNYSYARCGLAHPRVCRKTVKTEQLDVIPDPYYTSLADKVVQAGLLQFPNSALLNIVYASLQAALLNDPSVGGV